MFFREVRGETFRVVEQYHYAGRQHFAVFGADEFLGTISVIGSQIEVESQGCFGEALDFSDALEMIAALNIKEPRELVPDPITGLIF